MRPNGSSLLDRPAGAVTITVSQLSERGGSQSDPFDKSAARVRR